ncbi:MAG: hypothetical protein LAQ69_22375 [Acidobacteriia bacterium]|nr:hypothetical protein [Terriglobia bacterium]
MSSTKSGILDLIVGAAAVAASLFVPGIGPAVAAALMSAGSGLILAGAGTLIAGQHDKGFATTTRNPIAPWRVQHGRARVGGTVVQFNEWGDNSKMWDMVIILAAHKCQGGPTPNSLPVLLFDQQRIQLDTSKCPPGAIGGTSFTPQGQKILIGDIQRVGSVVTVVLATDIPYLMAGDAIDVQSVPGGIGGVGLTLNGKFAVDQIISRVPSGGTNILTFTFLSGGPAVHVWSAGYVHTLWADYGSKVYMEVLLGGQTLGETFQATTHGTPYDGDMGNFVSPGSPIGLGGGVDPAPDPWTPYCSLQGKTVVFLRLHYNDVKFAAGLPQISFLLWGKNDVYDPRPSPPTYGYSENAALCIADFLSNQDWGYKAAYGTDIPIAELIAAANVCDQAVATVVGGNEPRYTCNGEFTLDMRRGEILQRMLTCCAGRLESDRPPYVIQPGHWVGPGSPPLVLDLAAIAAGAVRWYPMPTITALYNGVKGTYISPANKWQAGDFPYYAQDALHGYSGPSLYGGDINLAADGGAGGGMTSICRLRSRRAWRSGSQRSSCCGGGRSGRGRFC